MSDVRLIPREGIPLCAVCKEPGDVVDCQDCRAGYHADCVENGKCPSIGCPRAAVPTEMPVKTERVVCWNCKGNGKEIINEMCRAHLYDCNRCGGTGYIEEQVLKGPTIRLTATGMALAQELLKMDEERQAQERRRSEESLRQEVEQLREDVRRSQERTSYLYKMGLTVAAMVLAVVFTIAYGSLFRLLGGDR